jgi:Fe-S oxidoreductase
MAILSNNYLGIPGYVLFWVLAVASLVLFSLRIYQLVQFLKLGRAEQRTDDLVRRIGAMLKTAFSQSSNLKSVTRQDPAAIGHAAMFWGLVIFALGYLIFIGLGAGFGLFKVYSGGTFERAFFSILDITALVVILSILYVIIKRYIIRPQRLERKQDLAEKVTQALLLMGMMSLMLLHYATEAFGYAAFGIRENWPPIGTILAARIVESGLEPAKAETVFKSLWWANFAILLCGLVYAPRSKHLHPVTSFFNLVFQNREAKGILSTVDLQKPENAGAGRIQDFGQKQLLDLYACTWCGRCHVVCPAQASGKELSPRELILGMKAHLLKEGPAIISAQKKSEISVSKTETMSLPESTITGSAPVIESVKHQKLIGDVISEDAIWACTTCRACQEVCPVGNEHVPKIIEMRRYLQMVATSEIGRDCLKNMRVRGNPWRGTMFGRTDWAEGMNIKVIGEGSKADVLFWVGCTEALEERSLKVAQATARVMQQAGINFGILGEEEICCGDPARRLGADHIFQMLASNNIQLLQSYNIKKIVTACPHCFNTLKNEYPQLGGKFEVIHHTTLLAELLSEKKIRLQNSEDCEVTYQEACYLGRYNGIYTEPRRIIGQIPGLSLVEMKQNREHGFCCGGGGGRMWLEEKSGQRISELRLAQVMETPAKVVATACPFCMQMLEDAVKSKELETKLKVKDIAELLSERLDKSNHINVAKKE